MPNPVKKMSFPAVAMILVASAGISGCLEEANELANSIKEANQNIGGNDNVVTENAAQLSWFAPAQRVSGDSLEIHNLKEYVIHYGQDPSSLDSTVVITDDNSGSMEYLFANLEEGEWFFAIRAVDVNGLESGLSQVVSKTL